MLHSVGGTYTTTTGGATITSSSCDVTYCECPNCGYRYSDDRMRIVVTDSVRNVWLDEPEPLVVAEPIEWPKPRSDIAPPHFMLALVRMRHHGRTLRHRAGFRNFHKVKN